MGSRSVSSSSSMLTMLCDLCLPIAHLKQIPHEQSLQKPLIGSKPCSGQPQGYDAPTSPSFALDTISHFQLLFKL